jgi:phage FluMu gp28-like protein
MRVTDPVAACRTLRALFLVENLDLEVATGVEGAQWEHFQLAHLNDEGTFRIENKSRQIAWSWLTSAEAVAEGALEGQGSIFVSINQEEAAEKLRYARAIIEGLRPDRRPSIKRDTFLQMEFENGARLVSLPSRPPRGKSRMNLYLDEFAHLRYDEAVYTAALPILSKGGRLRIGSSPLGASGRFWEVMTEKLRRYPGYRRKTTPWWETHSFCIDVARARKEAPGMTTAERVERFGRPRLVTIFENMPLEDFVQEYECSFVDESTAWITWEEIKAVQTLGEGECLLVRCRGKEVDKATETVDKLARMVTKGEIERVLYGGVDIGRTVDRTEIFLVGLSTVRSYPLRLAITLEASEFDYQMDVLAYIMRSLPVAMLLVDRTGIGRNLAENLERAFPGKVQGVDFTNPNKLVWASNAKMLIQQKRTPLPVDRDIAYQLHSIKRTVTAAKNLVFDVDANERHHADKYWSWALALTADQMYQAPEPLQAAPARVVQVSEIFG